MRAAYARGAGAAARRTERVFAAHRRRRLRVWNTIEAAVGAIRDTFDLIALQAPVVPEKSLA
jgi:hypothetical protein